MTAGSQLSAVKYDSPDINLIHTLSPWSESFNRACVRAHLEATGLDQLQPQ